MAKATDRELVFAALHDAIGWQQGLADAYAHIPDSPERREALEQEKAYRSLLRRRYGTDKSAMDAMLETAKFVPIETAIAGALAKAEDDHKKEGS